MPVSLLPGQYEIVSADYAVPMSGAVSSFYVVVDGDPAAMTSITECLEDNNQANVDGVTCPKVN